MMAGSTIAPPLAPPEPKTPAEPVAPAAPDDPSKADELDIVGTPFRRVDGWAKVTGQTRFADDLMFPRMLHMRLLRSTVPHANMHGIDTSAAESMPGVKGILTGQDMPEPFGILPVSQDEHALCLEKVRYVGDPVAAVAALTEEQAAEACAAIAVDYEPLTTIASVDEALATPEPRIHEYGDEGNLHKKISLEFGSVDVGFDEADVVYEGLYFYEGSTHLPMEQHAAVAVPEDGGRVVVEAVGFLAQPLETRECILGFMHRRHGS